MKKIMPVFIFLMIITSAAANVINIAPYITKSVEEAETLDELIWTVNTLRLHPVLRREYKSMVEQKLETLETDSAAEEEIIAYMLGILEDARVRTAWAADWPVVITTLDDMHEAMHDKPLEAEAVNDLLLQALFKKDVTSIYAVQPRDWNVL